MTLRAIVCTGQLQKMVTLLKEEADSNIRDVFVTFDVLSKSAELKLEAPKNIPCVVVSCAEFEKSNG